MLVELNRVYILTAPQSTAGLAQEADEYFEFTSTDMYYSFVKRFHKLKDDEKIHGYTKIFEWKGKPMQACIFIKEGAFPEKDAKKMVKQAVEKHKDMK